MKSKTVAAAAALTDTRKSPGPIDHPFFKRNPLHQANRLGRSPSTRTVGNRTSPKIGLRPHGGTSSRGELQHTRRPLSVNHGHDHILWHDCGHGLGVHVISVMLLDNAVARNRWCCAVRWPRSCRCSKTVVKTVVVHRCPQSLSRRRGRPPCRSNTWAKVNDAVVDRRPQRRRSADRWRLA